MRDGLEDVLATRVYHLQPVVLQDEGDLGLNPGYRHPGRRNRKLCRVVSRTGEWQDARNLLAVEQALSAPSAEGIVLPVLETPQTDRHGISFTVTPPMVSASQVLRRRVKWSSSSIRNTRHCRALSSPSASRPKKNGNNTGDTKAASRLGKDRLMAGCLALSFPRYSGTY